MLAKSLLALVGFLYLGLGLYCSTLPGAASRTVGFELPGPSGESEFLTVYGGLEVGMALVFLMPIAWPEATRFALAACLIIHGALVVWRTASFLLHPEAAAPMATLAIGEWAILLATIGVWFATRGDRAAVA